ISHVVMSIAKRCYNPGLITAVFLFIPLSIWSLIVVSKASHATAFDQWLGIGIGIFVHACIMAYMLMRRNKLRLEKTA
ncbi:MAG: HXXEE domain-containing protein, partial [Chthoniobacterales bacterium]